MVTSALSTAIAMGRRPIAKTEEFSEVTIRDRWKIKYPIKRLFKYRFNR